MKKSKTLLATIILFSYLSVSAQDTYIFPTKFLSFDNARLAIGLGLDVAINNMDMIQANFSNGVSLDTASRGLTNIGFSVDLYSPNSLIGFQSGVYWRLRDFVLYDQNVQDNQK